MSCLGRKKILGLIHLQACLKVGGLVGRKHSKFISRELWVLCTFAIRRARFFFFLEGDIQATLNFEPLKDCLFVKKLTLPLSSLPPSLPFSLSSVSLSMSLSLSPLKGTGWGPSRSPGSGVVNVNIL